MTGTERDDRIAKVRNAFAAQDEADFAKAHLRTAAALFDTAGYASLAAECRALVQDITERLVC